MDIPITFLLVELLRAGCVGGISQIQVWLHAQEIAPAQQASEESLIEAPAEGLPLQATSKLQVRPGVVWFQDPIGDSPSPLPIGPGSMASTDDALTQSWSEQLQAGGVGVQAGAIHTPGSGSSAMAGGGVVVPGSPRYKLREYTLFPPTPFIEPFTLMIPSPLPPTPQPLVVIFHKFGSGQQDVLQNTDFIAQCARRGWFLICPLAGSKKHFGSIESQRNTQAVLDWVLTHPSLRVDVKRIYGVGFSMGGGAMMNYAARHRDPAHAMFAALINHSGGVSLNDSYANDPAIRFILDFWFGDGSAGSANPWELSRSSVLDFDPLTLATVTTSDLARNLGSTPLRMLRASADPVVYVSTQNDALDQHFRTGLGRFSDASYSYNVVPYNGHSWSMLDASAACDWLAQYTLQVPTSGRTLVDVDGVVEHFFVEQDAGGAFTPFDWSLSSAANQLQVSASANLKRLVLDPIAAGLSTTANLGVTLQTADGSGDQIVLVRWPTAPSAVLRDGSATASWSYDALTLELTLVETDGAQHAWLVQP